MEHQGSTELHVTYRKYRRGLRYGEEGFYIFSLLSPVHYYNLLTTLTIIRTLDLIL